MSGGMNGADMSGEGEYGSGPKATSPNGRPYLYALSDRRREKCLFKTQNQVGMGYNLGCDLSGA